MKVEAPNGKIYTSIKGIYSCYGVSYNCYMDRINKGWSMEKALTVSRRCKSIGKSEKDPLGNVYKDRSSMCEAYGITMAAYHRHRRRWLTLEEAMTSRKEEADIKMREYRLNTAG